ncbi:MAG: protein kinase, partial [Actinomycetota bacterium]|nr:protein kinase [Actinomycetota bacterium]
MSDVVADRYELRGTLGTGGMARVVDGHDRLLDRRVAVKLLRSDLRGDPAVRRRFVREAQAAASFAHPHAVAVYDTGQDDAVPYIVMELVEGPTLADVIAQSGPLPVDDACTIACDVLDALAAAHHRGLVHRDVKPSNILLEPASEGPGRAKLTDFGIAKGAREATAALTAMGQVMGTAAYLSPEQARGEDATARSDLYSMGVVCYEMLAGRPPFTGEHALVVVLAHRDEAPPRLNRLREGLPPELTRVVHRSLEKDPVRRFDSAAAMREALRPFAGAGAGTSLPSALAAAATVKLAQEAD